MHRMIDFLKDNIFAEMNNMHTNTCAHTYTTQAENKVGILCNVTKVADLTYQITDTISAECNLVVLRQTTKYIPTNFSGSMVEIIL